MNYYELKNTNFKFVLFLAVNILFFSMELWGMVKDPEEAFYGTHTTRAIYVGDSAAGENLPSYTYQSVLGTCVSFTVNDKARFDHQKKFSSLEFTVLFETQISGADCTSGLSLALATGVGYGFTEEGRLSKGRYLQYAASLSTVKMPSICRRGDFGAIFSDSLNFTYGPIKTGPQGNVKQVNGQNFDAEKIHRQLSESVADVMKATGPVHNVVVAGLTILVKIGNVFDAFYQPLMEGVATLAFVSGNVPKGYKKEGYRIIGASPEYQPLQLLKNFGGRLTSNSHLVKKHRAVLTQYHERWEKAQREGVTKLKSALIEDLAADMPYDSVYSLMEKMQKHMEEREREANTSFGSSIDSEQYLLAYLNAKKHGLPEQTNLEFRFNDLLPKYKTEKMKELKKNLAKRLGENDDVNKIRGHLEAFDNSLTCYEQSTVAGYIFHLHSTNEMCCCCAFSIAEELLHRGFTQRLQGPGKAEPFLFVMASASQMIQASGGKLQASAGKLQASAGSSSSAGSGARPGIGQDNRLAENEYDISDGASDKRVKLSNNHRVIIQKVIKDSEGLKAGEDRKDSKKDSKKDYKESSKGRDKGAAAFAGGLYRDKPSTGGSSPGAGAGAGSGSAGFPSPSTGTVRGAHTGSMPESPAAPRNEKASMSLSRVSYPSSHFPPKPMNRLDLFSSASRVSREDDLDISNLFKSIKKLGKKDKVDLQEMQSFSFGVPNPALGLYGEYVSCPTLADGDCFFHAIFTQNGEGQAAMTARAAAMRAALCDVVPAGGYLAGCRDLVYEEYVRLFHTPDANQIPDLIRRMIAANDAHREARAACRRANQPLPQALIPEYRHTQDDIRAAVPVATVQNYMERYRRNAGVRTYIPVRPAAMVCPVEKLALQNNVRVNIFTFNNRAGVLDLIKTVGVAGAAGNNPIYNILIDGGHYVALINPAESAARQAAVKQIMKNAEYERKGEIYDKVLHLVSGPASAIQSGRENVLSHAGASAGAGIGTSPAAAAAAATLRTPISGQVVREDPKMGRTPMVAAGRIPAPAMFAAGAGAGTHPAPAAGAVSTTDSKKERVVN